MKKRRIRRRLIICFFLVGWVLTGAIYVLGQIDKVPLLTRVFYPSYSRAKEGLSKLQGDSRVLLPEDTGFAELESFCLEGIEKADEQTRDRVKGRTLVKLERRNAYLGFSEDRTREIIPIHFIFDDGSDIDAPLEDIQAATGQLKASTPTLILINVLWSSGYVISLVAFLLKLREEKASGACALKNPS